MRSALQLWCKSWRQLQCRREMPKPEIQSLKGRKRSNSVCSWTILTFIYSFMTNLLLMRLQVRTWQDPCIKAEKGHRKNSNSGDLNVWSDHMKFFPKPAAKLDPETTILPRLAWTWQHRGDASRRINSADDGTKNICIKLILTEVWSIQFRDVTHREHAGQF